MKKLQEIITNKAKRNGITVSIVHPAFTSQVHYKCLSIKDYDVLGIHKFYTIRKGVNFYCGKCRSEENADINASINIARLGLKKLLDKGTKNEKQKQELNHKWELYHELKELITESIDYNTYLKIVEESEIKLVREVSSKSAKSSDSKSSRVKSKNKASNKIKIKPIKKESVLSK